MPVLNAKLLILKDAQRKAEAASPDATYSPQQYLALAEDLKRQLGEYRAEIATLEAIRKTLLHS